MRSTNASAWITGAGRGIGRAMALRLAKEGASVGLTSRSKAELESVRAEVEGAGGHAVVAPVAKLSLDDSDLMRALNVRGAFLCTGLNGFSIDASDPRRAHKILQPEDVAGTLIAAVTLPARAMMSEIDLRPTNP